MLQPFLPYPLVILPGVTRERLESFDRAITLEPADYPDMRDTLIGEFRNYLGILKARLDSFQAFFLLTRSLFIFDLGQGGLVARLHWVLLCWATLVQSRAPTLNVQSVADCASTPLCKCRHSTGVQRARTDNAGESSYLYMQVCC